MKVNLLSPILIILMLALAVKVFLLFGRIEKQTNASDTEVTSMLVDSAYAKEEKDTHNVAQKQNEKQSVDKTQQYFTDYLSKSPSNSKEGKESDGSKDIEDTSTKSVSVGITGSEIKLLKELSKRREELDKNQDNIVLREQVLKATENKIDQKMSELKSLQTQLEDIMKQYDEKETGKIMSLVKIYENMKSRDAAKIFDELEMPVLLQIVGNMKEIKVAPIIAAMNPLKARDLSIELAKQKTLSN